MTQLLGPCLFRLGFSFFVWCTDPILLREKCAIVLEFWQHTNLSERVNSCDNRTVEKGQESLTKLWWNFSRIPMGLSWELLQTTSGGIPQKLRWDFSKTLVELPVKLSQNSNETPYRYLRKNEGYGNLTKHHNVIWVKIRYLAPYSPQ